MEPTNASSHLPACLQKKDTGDIPSGRVSVECTFSSIRKRLSSTVLTVPYARGGGSIFIQGNNDDGDITSPSPLFRSPSFRNQRDIKGRFRTLNMPQDLSPMIPIVIHEDSAENFEASVAPKLEFELNNVDYLKVPNVRASSPKSKDHIALKDEFSGDLRDKFHKKVMLAEMGITRDSRSDFKRSGKVSFNHSVRANADKGSQYDEYSFPSAKTSLPMIVKHDGDDIVSTKSIVSNKTVHSVSDSSSNSAGDHRKKNISKKRKVEFNLEHRRSLALPKLRSRSPPPNPTKSILKKESSSPSSSPYPSQNEVTFGDSDGVDISEASRWRIHLPSLCSPVPAFSIRKQPKSFKRKGVGLKLQCSKEFQAAAADDLDSEGNEFVW